MGLLGLWDLKAPTLSRQGFVCGGGLWSGTEFTVTEATAGLLYQSWMVMDDDECGEVGGMIGNQSTRRKPTPVPLCPPQIPHDLTWAAAVGNR
jgi:hypothetical protein